MHFTWNGLLSEAVVLQNKYGTRKLRFFGISIGWFGIGFIVGVKVPQSEFCECDDPTFSGHGDGVWRCVDCKKKASPTAAYFINR